MKKIFGFLICALLISVRVYAEADIPTDKSYTFDRANVASVLAEFIEDEKKAEKAADKYNELSNNSENAISAVDFVDVCVAGGMNMKLADGSGYMKCLDMFMKLIEMQNLDAGGFDMYCPATGNALKSITDKAQVGDVCGGTPDTYIEYGHVTLKTDDKNGQHKYVCTCTPQSCKDGYYWNKEKYQCSVKDKDGYCVRHILGSFEYKNGKLPTDSGVGLNDWNKRNNAYYNDKYAQINASTDAFNRCVEYGANQGCRIRGALASADVGSGFGSAKKYQVICNPENYEIAADKKVQEEKEQKHKTELAENSNYYEVCGKDKGRGTCIDNVFTRRIIGGTQVSYAVGNALVKEYARVRLGDEITCGGDSYDKNIRKSGTEYFIKCKSLKDLTKYYEFKFDDLEESKDLTANTSVYNAVWHIIYNYNIAKNSHNGYDTGTKANCDAVNATFKKICNGCGTEWRESGYIETKGKKFCYDVINIADNTTCKKSPNDLNTAFDIDPFVFCKNTHNQLKNTGSMESLLKQYISDNLTQYIAEHKELAGKFGYSKYNIECYPQTLCYTGSGCEGMIGHGDDIKTCVVHGDKDYTVDFVFDDVNEFSKKLNKGALQSMACVVSKGTFTGQECIVANKEQCDALIKSTSQICPECKKAKWNPTTKLCELPDAKTVTQLEKGKTIAMIVGGTVVAVGVTVATVGSGAPVVVIVLSGLEVVGGGIELGTQIHIDGMAHDFLLESVKCQNASCAERLIKENMQSLANITNDMQDYEINAVDEEFARLLKLIPEDSAFYQRIVENGATLEDNKKGFFDPEGWNQAQVWRAIGIGLQFSSLTTGVIKKLIEAPRFANKFPKLSTTLTRRVRTGKQITTVSKVNDAAKSATDFNALSKQIDDYAAQQKNIQKQILDLMDKYDIDATPIDPEELEQLLKKYPDLKKLNDEYVVLQQKIQKIRYENPGLWTPGEDVANYYDVEALQKKLKDIADEDAAYISELERKRAELIRTPEGVNKHTNEVSDEINRLRDQRSALVDESLKSQGLSYDDISNVGKEEMDALEQSLRSKDSELTALYEDMRQARSKDYSTWNKAYKKYQDRLKQYSEYNDLDAKIRSERKILDGQRREAQKVIEKENPDVSTLKKQIDELDHIYSPEYEAYLNEQEYVYELLRDAKKTVGDKQNLAWWDAVPQAIKDKYVQYMDDTMIKALASDSDLSYYVKNWDYVKDNSQLYEDFLQNVERKLNTSVLPEAKGVKISTYNDPNASTMGYHAFGRQVGMNTHYYMGGNVDKTISTVKHEILGHHIDDVAPNYGLQGETMQNFISENNNGFDKLVSHGNSDAPLTIAKSPILGTEFDVAGASDATKEALRNDGWRVFETSDPDSYARYRAEMAEREAWLITPTSDVQDKVDAARKTFGLPEMPKFNP